MTAMQMIITVFQWLGTARLTNQQEPTDYTNKTLVSSPPFYPSPWMSGQGEWAEAHAKAKEFVSQLTLLEKVNLTTGVGWEGEQCVGQVRLILYS